ncbi:hypothetical protein R1sor_007087 [Riccia sorocarpa]|uniref:Uncharacterized protein n=1 Tax=Riccia sorocarpa TaxID=122646 RepID=A0ABD3HR71_9MARC
MAAEKANAAPASEVMNNGGSKVHPGYRWNGDAMMLGRRRVGLSNGGSVSDASSEREEEEDEVEEEEDVAEDMSDDGGGAGADDEEEHEVGAVGSSRGRYGYRDREAEREKVGFDDAATGTEDEGSDEPELPDSPPPQTLVRYSDNRDVIRGDVRGARVSASRDRLREMTSPDDTRDFSHRHRMREVSSPELDDYETTYGSEGDRTIPMPRLPESSHQMSASEATRDLVGRSGKGSKGMIDATKGKFGSGPVNGEVKKVEREPPANLSGKRKVAGNGERTRFNTDNKARVTLERAREILAQVKANMTRNPKQFAMKHVENHVVEDSSSSEDEKSAMQLPPPRALPPSQVKMDEKLAKKRSRAAKGDKEAPPRRRKPKVEVDVHTSEEKVFYHRPHAESSGQDRSLKLGHFRSSGGEVTREGRSTLDVDGEDHLERKLQREEVFEQQTAIVEKKVRKRRKTKDGDDAAAGSTGICPGSHVRDENWEPPPSPFGLIQESLYKDPWKVLLSCMLLNKTAGRQPLLLYSHAKRTISSSS